MTVPHDLLLVLDEDAWDVPDRLTPDELHAHGGALPASRAWGARDETEEQ